MGSPIGITVSATDPEPGHTVTYFTVSADTQSAFFHVDQSSGEITLAHEVDADPPTSHSSFSFRVSILVECTEYFNSVIQTAKLLFGHRSTVEAPHTTHTALCVCEYR